MRPAANIPDILSWTHIHPHQHTSTWHCNIHETSISWCSKEPSIQFSSGGIACTCLAHQLVSACEKSSSFKPHFINDFGGCWMGDDHSGSDSLERRNWFNLYRTSYCASACRSISNAFAARSMYSGRKCRARIMHPIVWSATAEDLTHWQPW